MTEEMPVPETVDEAAPEIPEDEIVGPEGSSSPYDDLDVVDGVGFHDPEATELDDLHRGVKE